MAKGVSCLFVLLYTHITGAQSVCLSLSPSLAILWTAFPLETFAHVNERRQTRTPSSIHQTGTGVHRHLQSLSLKPHIIPHDSLSHSIHLFQITLLHIPFLNRNPNQTILQHPLIINPRMYLPK
jgi:hypothetical protein